jgi:hypothetical protein
MGGRLAQESAVMAVAAVDFENKFGRNLALPLNMRPDFSGAIAIDLALLGHPVSR